MFYGCVNRYLCHYYYIFDSKLHDAYNNLEKFWWTEFLIITIIILKKKILPIFEEKVIAVINFCLGYILEILWNNLFENNAKILKLMLQF